MNDILLSILATFATLMLGIIAKGVLAINAKQNIHDVKIENLTIKVEDVIRKTDSLHNWRNKLQVDQLEVYRQRIKELEGGT